MNYLNSIFASSIVLFIATLLTIQSAYSETDTNEAAVRAIADAYIKATYEGDAVTLTKLFHQTAVMNGYLGGKLGMGGPQPFIDQIENNPSLKSGGAPYKATIDYLHVSGRAASVTISETGFGNMSFTNYLNLIEENGEWKIVSKTYISY